MSPIVVAVYIIINNIFLGSLLSMSFAILMRDLSNVSIFRENKLCIIIFLSRLCSFILHVSQTGSKQQLKHLYSKLLYLSILKQVSWLNSIFNHLWKKSKLFFNTLSLHINYPLLGKVLCSVRILVPQICGTTALPCVWYNHTLHA